VRRWGSKPTTEDVGLLGQLRTRILVVAALFALLVLAGSAGASARYTGVWTTQALGGFRVGPNEPLDGLWQGSWDCKLTGCARGQARAVRSANCLRGRCARLAIRDDHNDLPDSVGFHLWRSGGRDGYGETYEGQGTTSHWRWAFRFGKGFPTRRSEWKFVNITEWHATGFDAPGHPLVINAQLGQIHATSYGWDGRENRGRSAWSCKLANSYRRGVWYKIRVDAHWSVSSDARLRVRLGNVGRPGWTKTCVRDDGYGNLFMDPNGRPDEIYMAQNLYRSASYTRDMVVYYDKTRQVGRG
jgi:hypothetical protein